MRGRKREGERGGEGTGGGQNQMVSDIIILCDLPMANVGIWWPYPFIYHTLDQE